MYSKKPVEYLEAVAKGEVPKWDNEKGGYVYGDSTVSDTVIGGKSKKIEDPQMYDDVDSDLPF